MIDQNHRIHPIDLVINKMHVQYILHNIMEKKITEKLDTNEKKFGADYQDRKVNNEGIIFDFSGRGYHMRVKNLKK